MSSAAGFFKEMCSDQATRGASFGFGNQGSYPAIFASTSLASLMARSLALGMCVQLHPPLRLGGYHVAVAQRATLTGPAHPIAPRAIPVRLDTLLAECREKVVTKLAVLDQKGCWPYAQFSGHLINLLGEWL